MINPNCGSIAVVVVVVVVVVVNVAVFTKPVITQRRVLVG